jgi:hypothetical protein
MLVAPTYYLITIGFMKKLWAKLKNFTQPIFESVLTKELIIGLILIGIVVFKFFPVFTGEKFFVLPGDTADLIYSDYVFVARTLKSGIFPLWNPHIFSGVPISSYPQVGLFYPFNLLFWILPYGSHPFPYQAYQYLVLFHIALAGYFSYLLFRGIRFNRFIALAASIVYMLTPNILLYIGWGSQITAFAWYPLLLLFLYKTFVEEKRIHAFSSGLTLGTLLLASPAQPGIMAIFMVGFFIASLFGYTLLFDRKSWLVKLIPRFVSSCIVLLIGFSVGAVALLPIMEFAPKTIRFLGIDGEVIGKQKIPMHAMLTYRSTAKQLWGFVFPEYATTPMAYNYYGLIPFIFALIAIFTRSFKKPLVLFATLFFGFSITYALGKIFPFIFYHLPFVNLIREPNKYLFFVSIAISVLFAYGLEFFNQKAERHEKLRTGLLLISIFSLTAFCALSLHQQVIPQLLLVGLGSLLLFTFQFFQTKFTIQKISLGLFLILLISDLSFFPINLVTKKDFEIDEYFSSQEKMLELAPKPGEMHRMAGIESETGWPYAFNAGEYVPFYDAFGYGNPLYFPFMDYRSRNGYCGKFYDLLNTKYFITSSTSDKRLSNCQAHMQKIQTIPGVFHVNYQTVPLNEADTVNVYENTNRLGYARLMRKAVSLPEGKDPIRFIDDQVDVKEEVVISNSKKYSELTAALSATTETAIASDSVSLVSYSPNKVILKVQATSSALLATADLYYPGWKAEVNTVKTEATEFNYVFRGAFVPAGESTVIFSYQPNPVFTGLFLTVTATLLSLACFWMWFKFKGTMPIWFETLVLICLLIMLGIILSKITLYNQFELKRYSP